MRTVIAPLARTDAAALEVLAAWHGLALEVAGAVDRRDPRVAATVEHLEAAVGLPRPTAHDERWPLLARRFARVHRVVLRDVATSEDAADAVRLAAEAEARLAATAPMGVVAA